MVSSLSPRELEGWETQGFIALKSFFSSERTQPINKLVNRLWGDRHSKNNPLVIDVFDGMPEGWRIFFKDAPDEAQRCPYKLNDLYRECPEVRELLLDPRLSRAYHDLIGGAPMLCDSINFEWGRQQDDHFDTFYMPPCGPNRMVGVWIAPEDVSPDPDNIKTFDPPLTSRRRHH